MSKVEKKHYVTFQSPGTMFAETTRKPIGSWDTLEAVKMAANITERHGAKPYAFHFTTVVEAAPVCIDGEKMEVKPKEVAKSCRHFIGGETLTYEQVVKRRLPDEGILRANMRCNDIAMVIENRNSYRSVQPFEAEDAIVDPTTGAIRARGSDPAMMRARAEQLALIERDSAR